MLSFRSKSGVFVTILASQLFLSTVLGTSVTYGVGHDKAPQGLNVWGKDLSGLPQEEALKRLENEIPSAVVYGEEVYPLEVTQTRQDLADWLRYQYDPATGNKIRDVFEYIKRLSISPDIPEKFNKDEVFPQLQTLSRINQPGKPAQLSYEKGELVVSEGIFGAKLDVEASWEALRQSQGGQPVPLVAEAIEVHPTTAELQRVKDPLGDFTTYFNPNLKERTNNVRLAAQAIDGLLIPPGEEFSFNDMVGKRERATGYLPAIVFIDNKIALDDGGGICQDSSTLYHAVRQAHLEILERNTHSLPVSYVPVGQDATVAYGLLDFRFRNNTQDYLLISARTGSNWLRIRIFGVADSEHPVLSAPDGYPIKPEDWIRDPK